MHCVDHTGISVCASFIAVNYTICTKEKILFFTNISHTKKFQLLDTELVKLLKLSNALNYECNLASSICRKLFWPECLSGTKGECLFVGDDKRFCVSLVNKHQ